MEYKNEFSIKSVFLMRIKRLFDFLYLSFELVFISELMDRHIQLTIARLFRYHTKFEVWLICNQTCKTYLSSIFWKQFILLEQVKKLKNKETIFLICNAFSWICHALFCWWSWIKVRLNEPDMRDEIIREMHQEI